MGLLSFFYDFEETPWGGDPADLSASRVIYTPTMDRLAAHETEGSDEWSIAEHAIEFARIETYPDGSSDEFESAPALCVLDDDQRNAYYDFRGASEEGERSLHHLLGHAHIIQEDMRLQAQLVTNGLSYGSAQSREHPQFAELAQGASDWMLLLQIDTDDTLNVMWGDAGMIYFWIRKEDLAARRFDQTLCVMQCC